jgi:hypothetical protein
VLSGIYRTDVPRRHPGAERKLALATMGELGVALLAPRRSSSARANSAAC